MRDNYATMAEQARQLFLDYDQEQLCARLGLPYDDAYIPIRYLDELLRIRRSDGQVLRPDGSKAGFNAVLSVYDVLCRSDTAPALKGQFVPFTALNRLHSTQPVHEGFHSREADRFNADPAGLHRACKALGGIPSAPGDICYILPVFDFFPCCLRFWEADDEFPASVQYFWDANALDFAHYETLWYMAGSLTDRLMELMKKEA